MRRTSEHSSLSALGPGEAGVPQNEGGEQAGFTSRDRTGAETYLRYDEVLNRWTEVRNRLHQLDTRVKLVLSGPKSINYEDTEHVEILNSPPRNNREYVISDRPPTNHRASFSSASSSQQSSRISSTNGAPTLSPRPEPLRHKSSFISAVSSSTVRTSDRPPQPGTVPTPANRRTSSASSAGRFNIASPTPSASSLASRSRLPVSSPVPRLSLSRPAAQGDLRSEQAMSTPSRPRPSATFSGASVPRPSLTPSFSRTSTGGTRTPRGPPSSFRSFTPTPAGRPSSRMSMASQAPSGMAPANLQPFNPSSYDLLDTIVQKTIDDVGFDRFVARVDPPLRKGQRKRDDEEWKGEYVFGAGQKTSSVKLLKLAGRGPAEGPRLKCLVRAQGAWKDLSSLLEERK